MLFSKILLEKGHQTNIQHHSILKQQKNISLQLTLSLLAIHNTYTLLHDNDIHLLKLMYFSRFWQKIYQVYHYLKEISKRKKNRRKTNQRVWTGYSTCYNPFLKGEEKGKLWKISWFLVWLKTGRCGQLYILGKTHPLTHVGSIYEDFRYIRSSPRFNEWKGEVGVMSTY